ncbi:MAG TPA: protein kinase [Planctomycetaceae bacterium]|nr:protein kinase [Planctomycetaceae bacterium]
MAASAFELTSGRTLASYLAQGVLPAREAIELVRPLAAQLDALHGGGRIHGAVTAEHVLLDEGLNPTLAASCPVPRVPRDSPAASFAGSADGSPGESLGQSPCIWLANGELGELLPELARLVPPELPPEIDAARSRLLAAGISLDPREVDIVQLGALLCRVLTGESAQGYLRSPRVKGKVPAELRPVVERCLGSDGQARFADIGQFLVALNAASGRDDRSAGERSEIPAAEKADREAAAPRSAGDTTPSFVSSANKSDDTSVGPSPAASRSSGSSESAAPSSQAPLPFSRLAHYEIVSRIGRGGMGDVYQGYERTLDRKVAIKVLPADLARSDDFIDRFKAEATAAAKLIHPNIIQIHLIGEDAGHHFFVMQYVEGESLAGLLSRRGKLPVEETLAIVEQALAGLAAAHEQGMVHRDIKPGNILLDRRNRRALLADFGLVKSLESSATGKTATGVIMGTVDYISPEQGRGKAVDGRSDLYSLGVLLYQMLSGRLPFEADNPTALVFQHVYEQPPSLAVVAPHVPAALASVIEKLLAKSPDDRHQSAQDVLADLRAFRSGERLPSWEAGKGVRKTTIVRLPAWDDPAGDDAALEAIPTGGKEQGPWAAEGAAPESPHWWDRTRERARSLFRRHAPEVLRQLENTQQQVDGAVAVYERRQRQLQQLEQEARSVVAELQKEAGQQRAAALAAQQRVQAAASPAIELAARAEEGECQQAAVELDRQIGEQQEQLEPIRLKLAQVRARVQQLRTQRDILQARLQAAGAKVRIEAGYTRRKRRVVALVAGVAVAAAFVAIGVFVSTRAPEQRLSRGEQLADEEGDSITAQAPVPRGAIGDDEVSESLKVRPRIPLRQFIGHEKGVTSVAFHPTEKLMASGGADGTIRLWRSDTGEQLKALEDNAGQRNSSVSDLAFSPDGRYLASAGGMSGIQKSDIRIWDIRGGTDPTILPGDIGFAESIAFSHDGRTLAAVHWQDSEHQLSIWNLLDESGIKAVEFDDFAPAVVACSPVAEVLACGGEGGRLQLWDLARSQPQKALKGCSDDIRSVKFSHDGWRIAAADKSGQVVVWDSQSGNVLLRLVVTEREANVLMFSPDDRYLAVAGGWTVHLWDTKLDRVPTVLTHELVSCLGFDPSGKTLATGGNTPALLLWDAHADPVVTGKSASNFIAAPASFIVRARKAARFACADGPIVGLVNYGARQPYQELSRRAGRVQAIAISDNGRYVVTGNKEGQLCLWDATLDKELRRVNVPANASAPSRPGGGLDVRSVAFAPDNRRVLVATPQTMFLWDIQTGEEIHHFAGPPHGSLVVGVSPDGRFAVAGGGKATDGVGDLRLWDMASGDYLRRFVGHVGYVHSVAFSHDSNRLISGGVGYLHLWDVDTGGELKKLKSPDRSAVTGAAFATDGQRAAGTVASGVILWDLDGGDEVDRFDSGNFDIECRSVGISPDGRYIAVGEPEGIRLWDINPRRQKTKR